MSSVIMVRPGLCVDALTRKTVPCPQISGRAPTSGPGIITTKCCLKPACCLDCDFFTRLKDCITSLVFTDPGFIAPGPPTGLSLSFDSIALTLNTAGCRYNINRATKVVTDTMTGTTYDCFSPAQGGDITVTNSLVLVPIAPATLVQCMLFSAVPCGLDPVGICWEVTNVDLGGGIYQPTYQNVRFCSAAQLVVDSASLSACVLCPSFNGV